MKKSKSGFISAFGRWLKGALTENVGLKVVCLACALVLVVYQRSGEEVKTRSVAFKIDVQLPPEKASRELMTTLPPAVKVTVEGSSRALDELASLPNTIDLDLRSGDRELVRIQKEDIEVPPGIKIKLVEPSSFELGWQDIITREVPIQPSLTGVVADGYEVSRPQVTPKSVGLRGPANIVNVTQFVRVAPLDVSGLSQGHISRLLALDQEPERTRYVGSPNATVEVDITRRLTSAKFSRVPVEVVGLVGARATPAAVNITVTGPPEVVNGLDRELIVPRVDITSDDSQPHGSAMRPVVVELSNAQVRIQPPKVKVSW